jgi:hypothetical protein
MAISSNDCENSATLRTWACFWESWSPPESQSTQAKYYMSLNYVLFDFILVRFELKGIPPKWVLSMYAFWPCRLIFTQFLLAFVVHDSHFSLRSWRPHSLNDSLWHGSMQILAMAPNCQSSFTATFCQRPHFCSYSNVILYILSVIQLSIQRTVTVAIAYSYLQWLASDFICRKPLSLMSL